MLLALMAGWICALVSLFFGYPFSRTLAVYMFSGLSVFVLVLGLGLLIGAAERFAFVLVLGVNTLVTSLQTTVDALVISVQMAFQGWRLGRARKKLAFADGHSSSYARAGLGLIALGSKALSKPADWMQISRAHSSLQRGRCFVLADTSISQSRQLVYDLSLIGYDVDMCTDHEAVMGSFRSGSGDCRWSLLVVDLDFLIHTIELEDIIGDLLLLRKSAKNLNVIILSNEVGRDDNGLSRLSIADVSLRAPVSLERLRRGIWNAQANNMIWQDRLRDMEADISPP